MLGFFAALFGSMMHAAQRDKTFRESAEKLIATAEQKRHSVVSGQVIFRKARLPAYPLLVLLLGIFCIALYGFIDNWVGFSTGMLLLASLGTLAAAIRQFRYKVHVSGDNLTISDLMKRSVPLRDIGEVTFGGAKGTFCRIRLNTGDRDLNVASDLENFPEFVSLLFERVNLSKTRDRTRSSPGCS